MGIGTRRKDFYYFALAVLAILAINILLTVKEEFGAFDLATLFIDVLLLGLLIGIRKELQRSAAGLRKPV